VKKLLLFLSLGLTLLQAENFVNDKEKIIMEKAVSKINEMSSEIYEKTNIKIILNVLKQVPQGETLTTYEEKFQKTLTGSYVVVNFSELDKKINLIKSSDIDFIDKDEILDDFIIPLLVTKNNKVTTQQKYSAALLNGMAEISDQVANNKKIVLTSSIGSESKNFIDGLSFVIQIMIVLTILAFGYAWYNRKKNG